MNGSLSAEHVQCQGAKMSSWSTCARTTEAVRCVGCLCLLQSSQALSLTPTLLIQAPIQINPNLQVGPCSCGEGVYQGRTGGLVWAKTGRAVKPLVQSGAH